MKPEHVIKLVQDERAPLQLQIARNQIRPEALLFICEGFASILGYNLNVEPYKDLSTATMHLLPTATAAYKEVATLHSLDMCYRLLYQMANATFTQNSIFVPFAKYDYGQYQSYVLFYLHQKHRLDTPVAVSLLSSHTSAEYCLRVDQSVWTGTFAQLAKETGYNFNDVVMPAEIIKR